MKFLPLILVMFSSALLAQGDKLDLVNDLHSRNVIKSELAKSLLLERDDIKDIIRSELKKDLPKSRRVLDLIYDLNDIELVNDLIPLLNSQDKALRYDVQKVIRFFGKDALEILEKADLGEDAEEALQFEKIFWVTVEILSKSPEGYYEGLYDCPDIMYQAVKDIIQIEETIDAPIDIAIRYIIENSDKFMSLKYSDSRKLQKVSFRQYLKDRRTGKLNLNEECNENNILFKLRLEALRAGKYTKEDLYMFLAEELRGSHLISQKFIEEIEIKLYQVGEKTLLEDRITLLLGTLIPKNTPINDEEEGECTVRFSDWSVLASLYSRIGQCEKAIECHLSYLGYVSGFYQKDTYYNLACLYSRKSDFKKSLESLETAINSGYQEWYWILEDGDLKNLREDPSFVIWFLDHETIPGWVKELFRE